MIIAVLMAFVSFELLYLMLFASAWWIVLFIPFWYCYMDHIIKSCRWKNKIEDALNTVSGRQLLYGYKMIKPDYFEGKW